MKITITSDIRKLQVNFPDTATAIALENRLFAEINKAVENIYAASVTEKNEIQEQEEPCVYVPAEKPVDHNEQDVEARKYWGLFRIVCPNCGDVHEFGVKRENGISYYRCAKCGEKYVFESEMELVPVDVYCPNCQNACTVRTNDTGNTVSLTCVSCKSVIDAFWNAKKHRYETEV